MQSSAQIEAINALFFIRVFIHIMYENVTSTTKKQENGGLEFLNLIFLNIKVHRFCFSSRCTAVHMYT